MSVQEERARIFDLGGTGLKTAIAILRLDGRISITDIQQLGGCSADERPSVWIHRQLAALASDIYADTFFSFSLAGLDKLWFDHRDRSDNKNIGRLLGLPQHRCSSRSDGYAHLISSTQHSRRTGLVVEYPVWNIAIGTGVAVFSQTAPEVKPQEVCKQAYNLPCMDWDGHQRAVYAVLGGAFNDNANMRGRSTESRRRYEQRCVQFVLLTVANQSKTPISCEPRTVFFTGGLIDNNSSLFTNVGTQHGIKFIRGPNDGGLIGAAYMAFDASL
jgi:hypothetical protein